MSPRQRRLIADRDDLLQLAASGVVSLTTAPAAEIPDRYIVRIRTPGLERDSDGRVRLRHEHEFSLYLPLDYPRKPPAITWRTPIFHPNILGPDRHGAVCLGSWAPGEGLADLCRRLIRMAAYETFNLEDALDRDAAAWARAQAVEPGDGLRDVVAAAA